MICMIFAGRMKRYLLNYLKHLSTAHEWYQNDVLFILRRAVPKATADYGSLEPNIPDLQWEIVSTNGKGYLTKQPSLSDHGLFLTYLILTIITILFAVFW